MSKKNTPPSISATAFDCPYCGAFTSQEWFTTYAKEISGDSKIPFILDESEMKKLWPDNESKTAIPPHIKNHVQQLIAGQIALDLKSDSQYGTRGTGNLSLSQCYVCAKVAVWVHDKLIFPPERHGQQANGDLPEDVLFDYEEARSIVNLSPRGAAALLRLAIQKLCIFLGEKGSKIDDDIASLVAKGLNPLVQKSLDIVRVIGNEAVHPGVIDLKDDRDTATKLFGLVNLIADQMITHPKNVHQMYDDLPDSKKEAIAKRDSKLSKESKNKS